MTKKSDLKARVRARMKKAGEKYAEARRNILAKRPTCVRCGDVLEAGAAQRDDCCAFCANLRDGFAYSPDYWDPD